MEMPGLASRAIEHEQAAGGSVSERMLSDLGAGEIVVEV